MRLDPAIQPEIDGTTLAVSRVVLAERYRAARDAEVLNGFWELHHRRLLLMVPAGLAVAACLRLAGLEQWRLSVIGFAFTTILVLQTMTRSVLASAALTLGFAGVASALTGGAESPFVITFVSVPASAIVSLGRGRASLAVLAATGVLLGLVALEPASWAGPAMGRPYDVIVTVIMLVFGVFFVVRAVLNVSDANVRAHEQIDLLREETLNHLCERARGLQSVGAKVAHELKNPLASIKGLCQLVARAPRERAHAGAARGRRLRDRRMETILHEYLSFSRPLEDLTPEAVDLGALARDVARRARRARARPRRRRCALDGAPPPVRRSAPAQGGADQPRRQRDRGDAERRRRRARRAHRRRRRASTIDVEDTGRGIAPEDLARLGTSFFTTRPNGTGLGVVLAQGVITQHGGSLALREQRRPGTTATITLPATRAAPSRRARRDGEARA